MREISIENIKDKFFEYSPLLQTPLKELEQVWDFMQRVFLDRYPRIRFYVANPQDEKYYGFRSVGMGRDFEKRFDRKGHNPFLAPDPYVIGFNEVPKDLKHPIEGDEENYILTFERLNKWCVEGNTCPQYIQDIGFGTIIDESLTIHIPHRLSKKAPLAAISLDFGKKGNGFSKDEIKVLIGLIGVLLRDAIASLVEDDLEEAKNILVHSELESDVSKGQAIPPVIPLSLQSEFSPPSNKYGLVYNGASDHVLNNTFTFIEAAAGVNSNVLITGESGTGKELVANAVHLNSQRKQKDLMKINCGAFNDELLRSELFGYEKGAFTGATEQKHGLFESADGGTIFLDEIGDISPVMQVNLLRVLEDKTFLRIGGTTPIQLDVRLIFATNKDLKTSIAERNFREDLYYRLNVIEIRLPSLRDRKGDLLPLLRFFARFFCNQFNINVPVFIDPAALELLFAHDWKGSNVRELRNYVERALALLGSRDTITILDLPTEIQRLDFVSHYSDTSKILLYPGSSSDNFQLIYGANYVSLEEINSDATARVDTHLVNLKKRGIDYLNEVFPLNEKDDQGKRKEFKALLMAITGDKKKYIDENINNPFCNSCDKNAQNVTHYLSCQTYKDRGCLKPILPPGTFESRYGAYEIKLSTKQGRPTKRLQEKNLNQKVKIENNSPHRDIEIKCKELLLKAGFKEEEAIKEIDCNTFLKAYEDRFKHWGEKPEKEVIAIREAYEIAKISK